MKRVYTVQKISWMNALTVFLEVRIENTRTMARMKQQEIENTQLSPLEAFREFYQMMNDQPMSEEEELELQQIIAKCDGSKEG